jgi:hypothetical protein
VVPAVPGCRLTCPVRPPARAWSAAERRLP